MIIFRILGLKARLPSGAFAVTYFGIGLMYLGIGIIGFGHKAISLWFGFGGCAISAVGIARLFYLDQGRRRR